MLQLHCTSEAGAWCTAGCEHGVGTLPTPKIGIKKFEKKIDHRGRKIKSGAAGKGKGRGGACCVVAEGNQEDRP